MSIFSYHGTLSRRTASVLKLKDVLGHQRRERGDERSG